MSLTITPGADLCPTTTAKWSGSSTLRRMGFLFVALGIRSRKGEREKEKGKRRKGKGEREKEKGKREKGKGER